MNTCGHAQKEKVIFCDIGNVLLFFDLFKSINRYLSLGKKSARIVLPHLFDPAFIHDFETGKITPQAFCRMACELFGMRMGFDMFCEIWNDIFVENKALTQWIKEVSARHRVYIISNTNLLHYEAIRKRYDFFSYVHGAVISCEVGLRKPDPRIFYRAIQIAGVAPGQIFYLDDIWDHVYSARRCGIRAEHYRCAHVARDAWNRFSNSPSIL